MDISDSAVAGSFSDIKTIVANSFGSIDQLYEQGREITGWRRTTRSSTA